MKKQGIRRGKILSMPRKIMKRGRIKKKLAGVTPNRDRKDWKIGEMRHRAEKELSLSHFNSLIVNHLVDKMKK